MPIFREMARMNEGQMKDWLKGGKGYAIVACKSGRCEMRVGGENQVAYKHLKGIDLKGSKFYHNHPDRPVAILSAGDIRFAIDMNLDRVCAVAVDDYMCADAKHATTPPRDFSEKPCISQARYETLMSENPTLLDMHKRVQACIAHYYEGQTGAKVCIGKINGGA